ncbi:arabinosyltransferase domain-containing protein [Actinopolyspora mortivallis]|uniref:Arabinosyltransferase n=1 Tax=Actinopolyspora mortivallis TaxID=33906 RepID=A0A2T0GV69_ACTMO|nr:arabinosyltransferase domain-containing protein [Actinopolyspora mortivallis]PRW63016.1 arabinosyltransferase [Actinopolyspora mortivallis]
MGHHSPPARPASETHPGTSDGGHTRRGNRRIALLAGLTVLLGALAVLAPVRVDDPVITWPEEGEPPVSTVVPLSPYRPLSMEAVVPCAAVRQVNGAAEAGERAAVLRTQPPDGQQGLSVTAGDGTVRFRVSGETLHSAPVPEGDCSYRITAGRDGVRLLRGDTTLQRRPELLAPQVAELSTAAEGTAGAEGLSVRLHTDARYESRPSALKLGLLLAHALALATTLVLAWRHWGGTRSMRRLRVPRPGAADAVLVLVSVAWIFLGPTNMDDGWYLMMARNAVENGYVGNFVYMFNVTENPFVLSQYLLQLWGWLGDWSLWWMRVVPTVCGIATWFLLRILLATVLGRAGGLRIVPWALLVAHLVWYLPYGTTLRPEPVIVLCAAATLVLAEAALLRRSVGMLAVATVCAVLGVTASPTGVVAAAPLVLSLPWLFRWLRGRPWSARIGAVLLALASASVIVPVGFADASLGDVLEAYDVHQWYYLSYSWYEEYQHYETLLDTAGWARRLPVLLTLALIAVVAVGSGRSGAGRDPVRRLLLVSAVTSAVGLALLSLSPTKWVNHFHAAAAAPTVLLAAALIRSPLPRRRAAVASTASLVLLIAVISLSYAGGTWWIPFSDAGQPFGNHLDPDPDTANTQPHVEWLYLRNPVVWLSVAGAALAWGYWRARRGRAVLLSPDRAVLGAASLTGVLLLVASFSYAPVSQWPGWTIASSGVRTMFGDGCGLAEAVEVQLPVERGLAPPERPPRLEGDFRTDRPVPLTTSPWDGHTELWHDDVPDGTSTGTGKLTTGWYRIPRNGAGTHVTVPLAGALGGQRLRVEFGAVENARWRVLGSRELSPDTRMPLREWQQLSARIPPRAEGVRVALEDRVTGAHTWIAAAEPRLTSARPISEITRDRPVLANHIGAAEWPCANQVAVNDGITDTPRVRMTVDQLLPPSWPDNISNLSWGGAWVQTAREWEQTRLSAELRPSGPERKKWGHVYVLRYRHPVGRFDTEVHERIRWGWERLPTLADNDYPNITDNAGTDSEEDENEE